MQAPRTLKDMNAFGEGGQFLGLSKTFKRPKLARKFEDWRGAGMDSALKIDVGAEPIEVEHTYHGDVPELRRAFGAQTLTGASIRWVGGYQRDDTGALERVEIIVRGRHEEIDSDAAEVGKLTETKFKTNAAYYKETRNGVVEIEIDVLGGIYMIHGVDRRAELRALING